MRGDERASFLVRSMVTSLLCIAALASPALSADEGNLGWKKLTLECNDGTVVEVDTYGSLGETIYRKFTVRAFDRLYTMSTADMEALLGCRLSSLSVTASRGDLSSGNVTLRLHRSPRRLVEIVVGSFGIRVVPE
jgi:hypothetical protein